MFLLSVLLIEQNKVSLLLNLLAIARLVVEHEITKPGTQHGAANY